MLTSCPPPPPPVFPSPSFLSLFSFLLRSLSLSFPPSRLLSLLLPSSSPPVSLCFLSAWLRRWCLQTLYVLKSGFSLLVGQRSASVRQRSPHPTLLRAITTNTATYYYYVLCTTTIIITYVPPPLLRTINTTTYHYTATYVLLLLLPQLLLRTTATTITTYFDILCFPLLGVRFGEVSGSPSWFSCWELIQALPTLSHSFLHFHVALHLAGPNLFHHCSLKSSNCMEMSVRQAEAPASPCPCSSARLAALSCCRPASRRWVASIPNAC